MAAKEQQKRSMVGKVLLGNWSEERWMEGVDPKDSRARVLPPQPGERPEPVSEARSAFAGDKCEPNPPVRTRESDAKSSNHIAHDLSVREVHSTTHSDFGGKNAADAALRREFKPVDPSTPAGRVEEAHELRPASLKRLEPIDPCQKMWMPNPAAALVKRPQAETPAAPGEAAHFIAGSPQLNDLLSRPRSRVRRD